MHTPGPEHRTVTIPGAEKGAESVCPRCIRSLALHAALAVTLAVVLGLAVGFAISKRGNTTHNAVAAVQPIVTRVPATHTDDAFVLGTSG